MNEQSLIHHYRPPTAGAGPRPALLLMHGMGSKEDDLVALTPFLDPQLHVIVPRAPLRHSYGGYNWYELDREGAGLGSASIEAAITQLVTFLDQMVKMHGIDPERVYAGGFSMGAAMAGALTLLHPDRVAGAVMVSGYLPPPDAPDRYRAAESRGKPFFQAHGTLDTRVPLSTAHRVRDYLLSIPVDLTYREYPIGHSVSPAELADLAAWFRDVLATSGATSD